MNENQQQKMIELQILNQQAEQLRQYLTQLEEQLENVKNLQESLDAIENEKIGKEMYSPLSSGIFVKTELKENKEVLVAVGAGVIVKKNVKDAKKLLKEQENKMELIFNNYKEQFERFAVSAANIEKELSEEQ